LHAPKVASLLDDAELGLLAFHASLPSTTPSCVAPFRWNGSTAGAAPLDLAEQQQATVETLGAQDLGRRGASQVSPGR
jgi:hypothetical protein